MVICSLLLLCQPDQKTKLTSNETSAVRNAVYRNELSIVFDKKKSREFVVVPSVVQEAYSKNKTELLELLIVIMHGANPNESIIAASFAFELVDGPGGGVICTRVFKKSNYDTSDKRWGLTPRDHWIGHLRKSMRELDKSKQ